MAGAEQQTVICHCQSAESGAMPHSLVLDGLAAQGNRLERHES